MADVGACSLVKALKDNKLRESERLLLEGVNPNTLVEHGTLTAMHLAAGLGLEPICLLLQYGGDPNVCNEDRTTPLHISAMWGYADSVQILLANGGDPYLKDLDGMSALDLADQYQHAGVQQVLQHYMTLLARAGDQTITPKFTYIRRSSTSSSSSDQSGSPTTPDRDSRVDVSLYDSQILHDYLHEFARRRRSSVYLRSIQSQVNKFFEDGQKTHLVDVTSPDHPYVEPRYEAADETCDQSLNLHLSVSDDEQSTWDDSFVTCNGEDPATVLNNSDDESPFDRSLDCMGTVKKNPKFSNTPITRASLNNSCSTDNTVIETHSSQGRKQRSYRGRGDKYCKREASFDTSEFSLSGSLPKCDYCGCIADAEGRIDETVCNTCEKLAIELDKITMKTNNKENKEPAIIHKETSGARLPDLLQTSVKHNQPSSDGQCNSQFTREFREEKDCKYFQVGKSHNSSSSVPRRDVLAELSRQLGRTGLDTRMFDQDKPNSETIREKVKPHIKDSYSFNSNVNGSTMTIADEAFCKTDLGDSLISADSTFLEQPIRQARFHPSDISTITLDDNSCEELNVLDQAYAETSTLRLQNKHIVKPNKIFDKHEYVKNLQKDQSAKVKNVCVDRRRNDEEIKSAIRVDNRRPRASYEQSPEINDLWSEVRASSLKRRSQKRADFLDTAFCGRDSLGSVLSDASTVEYVYTDKETGIVLLERHIPSQCGSAGSRRSLDSLFSQNTNENISPKNRPARLDSTQDTILYNWHDDAMIQDPDNQSNQAGDCTVSSDLLGLDNDTLRKTLVDLGDDPGPVTKTTRQAYLRRLSQIQNDPDTKPLTMKGPDFPPELSAAFKGTLDLSEMSELEVKMLSTFQNPDRQRRWREGTLKSSFNYILLDPRITRDLPNRSAYMTDLEVFQTFVYATFYIGKGKRARPYSHLYEAIKKMKNPAGKTSDKVEKILEIWSGDQGVVSLHCFQSVIPVEAYTREACMVDAVGLAHLTNKKRGDYYGVSTTYSMKQRRKMGVFLLTKALQIFLAEGERQISPLDIKNDP